VLMRPPISKASDRPVPPFTELCRGENRMNLEPVCLQSPGCQTALRYASCASSQRGVQSDDGA